MQQCVVINLYTLFTFQFYLKLYKISDNDFLQSMSNHPVHSMDQNVRIMPSSFIPFCEYGGNMSVVGMTLDGFDLPICDKFRPKMLEGQLCYQIDVNEVKDQVDANNALKHGLIFAMDYNEDRMIQEGTVKSEEPTYLNEILGKKYDSFGAHIYIESLGISRALIKT